MQTYSNIRYEQVRNLAFQLSHSERKKLINELLNKVTKQKERKFGKYAGQGSISEDFNEPLEELFNSII